MRVIPNIIDALNNPKTLKTPLKIKIFSGVFKVLGLFYIDNF